MVDHKFKSSTIIKVKRGGYTKLEELAFQNSGIIYGGYVRDNLIFEESKERFCNKFPGNAGNAGNASKYWDKTFSPETSNRLLVPNDMDVCFYSSDDADNFISEVQRVREFDRVFINDATNKKYYSPMIHNVKHMIIHMTIGRIPFLTPGVTAMIAVDVVIPKANIMREPPFNNLDMLCNGFIKTKDGVRLSKNTGTVIDFYSEVKRMKVSAGIVSDMVQSKTYMCFSKSLAVETSAYNFNLIAMRRVMKLYSKGWTFPNMPFKIEDFQDGETDTSCCICSVDFEEGDQLSYTMTHKNGVDLPCAKMHNKCFMKYLNHQRMEAPANIPYDAGNDEDAFVFKCPYRNPVDFRNCIMDIHSVYLD
jgi:hypothetical protein